MHPVQHRPNSQDSNLAKTSGRTRSLKIPPTETPKSISRRKLNSTFYGPSHVPSRTYRWRVLSCRACNARAAQGRSCQRSRERRRWRRRPFFIFLLRLLKTKLSSAVDVRGFAPFASVNRNLHLLVYDSLLSRTFLPFPRMLRSAVDALPLCHRRCHCFLFD